MAELMGPDFITLRVRDLEASRHFYADVIGFKSSAEVRPNAFAFSTKPIAFAVRKTEVDLDAVSQLGHGVILWFKADDSVALHKQLKEGGVIIVEGIADSPFGKTFTFRDPDGYLISVHDGG